MIWQSHQTMYGQRNLCSSSSEFPENRKIRWIDKVKGVPHLASKEISAWRKPSSVTTSTSPSWKGIEPVDDANDDAVESGGMSLKDRTELVESRFPIVGVCTGFMIGDTYGVNAAGICAMAERLRTLRTANLKDVV